MKPSNGILFLKLLLNRYHPGQNVSLKALPVEEAEQINSLEIQASDPTLLFPKEKILTPIHYSWFMQVLQHIPQALRPSFFSVLPSLQAERLKPMFHVEHIPALSEKVRAFLLNSFIERMDYREILPLDLLPDSPLNKLCSWNKHKLVELIDFLGIHDLAYEVRQMIDKESLKKLNPCLTPKKKQFLHLCLHNPDKLISNRLDLDRWDGDCVKLNKTLHLRGLTRLAKALCGQHPDLIWHIAHRLDTGRGNFLQEHYSQTSLAGVTPVLVQQVTNLMSFFKP